MGFYDSTTHKMSFFKEETFLTKDKVSNYNVGIGDEVFMIGRFINLQGTKTNRPAARFGSLSVMNTMIPIKKDGVTRRQESYAVEMRSRTGFSGSPVMLYRTKTTVLMDVPEEAKAFSGLLGANWGYINDELGENTWLNGVVPAWKISELLNTQALTEQFLAAQALMKELADALRRVFDAGLR